MFQRNVPQYHCGWSLTEVIVVMAIVTGLLAIALPAVQAARESAGRTACANNLRQNGIAWQHFEATQGKLPSDDWAIELLDYLELTTIATMPSNLRGGQDVRVFRCPNQQAERVGNLAVGSYRVNAFVIGERVWSWPRSTVVLMDETGDAGAWSFSPRTFAVDPAATRHLGGGNLLWGDGHITFLGTGTSDQPTVLDPFE